MKSIPLLLLLLHLLQLGFSQTKIKAKIQAENLAAIPFASISIKKNSIGTISNTEGDFEIQTPDVNSNKKLLISCIGYKTRAFSVDSLIKERAEHNNIVLTLEKKSYQLNEIIINKQFILKNPYEIVSKAINNLPNMLPNKTYNYKAFYRQKHSNESCLTRLIECAISIHDPGISKSTSEIKVNIDQLKTSLDNRYFNYKLCSIHYEVLTKKRAINLGSYNDIKTQKLMIHDVDSVNNSLLDFIQKKSKIRNYNPKKLKRGHGLNPNFVKEHSLILDTILVYNNEPTYKIKILPHPKKYIHKGWGSSLIPLGFMYIRLKDYAIMELEYALVQNPRSKKKSIIKFYGTSIRNKTIVKYKEFEGKMHPYYVSYKGSDMGNTFELISTINGHSYIEKEMLITEIISCTNINSNENAKLEWDFDLYKHHPMDSTYWESNIIMMPTLKEQNMKRVLEKKIINKSKKR